MMRRWWRYFLVWGYDFVVWGVLSEEGEGGWRGLKGLDEGWRGW